MKIGGAFFFGTSGPLGFKYPAEPALLAEVQCENVLGGFSTDFGLLHPLDDSDGLLSIQSRSGWPTSPASPPLRAGCLWRPLWTFTAGRFCAGRCGTVWKLAGRCRSSTAPWSSGAIPHDPAPLHHSLSGDRVFASRLHQPPQTSARQRATSGSFSGSSRERLRWISPSFVCDFAPPGRKTVDLVLRDLPFENQFDVNPVGELLVRTSLFRRGQRRPVGRAQAARRPAIWIGPCELNMWLILFLLP